MTILEQVELDCRRLLAAKEHERSDILVNCVGYLGLARAYVDLMNEHLKLKSEINES